MSATLADMALRLSASYSPVPRSGVLKCAALVVALLATVPGTALAWGAMGHRLVAALAADELTPAASAEVATLLEGEANPSLPGIAAWADDLRKHDPDLGRRSSRWHFVNLGEQQCTYEPARDCPDGDCVVGALESQVAILADRHPDVVEMDAASRTGIEDVREIIEATRFRPMQARAKVFVTHIPYRGSGPMLQDLLGGQIDMSIDNLPSALPHIKAGRLVPIVVAAPQRLAVLPDVPTFKEVGLEPVNRMAYYGLIGPKGLPQDVVDKVYNATKQALTDPAVKKRIEDTGSLVVGNTPAEFSAQIKAEFEVYKQVVVKQKLKLE